MSAFWICTAPRREKFCSRPTLSTSFTWSCSFPCEQDCFFVLATASWFAPTCVPLLINSLVSFSAPQKVTGMAWCVLLLVFLMAESWNLPFLLFCFLLLFPQLTAHLIHKITQIILLQLWRLEVPKRHREVQDWLLMGILGENASLWLFWLWWLLIMAACVLWLGWSHLP